MRLERAVAAGVLCASLALLAVGIWLLSATPSALVNETPPRLGPQGGTEEPVIVAVEEGDSADTVAGRLQEAGVIESARLFRTLVSMMGLADELAAGEYEFTAGETALSAVRRISEGVTSPVVFAVPEGLRSEEIAQGLEQRDILAATDFLAALEQDYDAAFLEALQPGSGLEGFLFPATYGLSRDPTGTEAVEQMLQAFDQRYLEEIQPRLGGQPLIEVITLASIVEREAVVADERPIIASVYLNRLAAGFPLQADPTVQYAVAQDPASVAQYGFWKQELSLADLAIDSPYNTYTNVGLPPGPIANPGLDSILAVLDPVETDFLFFVARPDGSHVFAESGEEHQNNVCALDPSRPECAGGGTP
jgi:UPF0755 protein